MHRVVLVQHLEAVGGHVEPPERARQAGGQVAEAVVGQVQDAQVSVRRELDVQVLKSVVGQVEGADVVLQALGQMSQPPPGAVCLPVAVFAGAHGGTHGQDPPRQQRHEQQSHEGFIRGSLREHVSAERQAGRQQYEHSLCAEAHVCSVCICGAERNKTALIVC